MARFTLLSILVCSFMLSAYGQTSGWQPDLSRQQTYVAHRASSPDRRLLWTWTWLLLSLAVRTALGRKRQELKLLLPHAVPGSRADYRYQRRRAAHWELLLQH